MKRQYSLSYRRYGDSPTCTNIVIADSAGQVEGYASAFEWFHVSEVGDSYVEEHRRRGMPVVEL